MNLLPPSARLLSSISGEQRLALLQEHDRLRKWEHVDELRICICCGRKLSGRLMQIWSDSANVWFRCHTSNCTGSLADFARSGDPLFDDEVWEDWCKSFKTESADECVDKAV